MLPSPSHVPFSVPYPSPGRRSTSMSGSTSEASSASDSDETRIAYKDNEDYDEEHDKVDQTTARSHTYPPPTPSTAKANKNMLKPYSDTVESLEKSLIGQHEQNDVDDEDPNALLDEEERVGLMMQERQRHAPPPMPTSLGKGKSWQKRCKPFIFASAIALFILILLPLLRWLSSSTLSNRRESVLQSGKHLTEVIMPSYWSLPEASRPSGTSGGISKHKRPLPKGTSKLTKFGPPFQLESIVEPVPSVLTEDQKQAITMDDALGTTFTPFSRSLSWSAEDPDEGVFSFLEPYTNNIILQDVTHYQHELTGQGEIAKGGGKVTFVQGSNVRDSAGKQVAFTRYKISPDMRFVLLFSDTVQQWRYSSFSKVWLHDVSGHSTVQLGKNFSQPTIATAEWSKRSFVSYVEGNNLYVIKDVHDIKSQVSVTTDGAVDVFNAVPDWVYEEEVYSGDSAHWWSPDGNRVAFLRFDETLVHTYSFPIYNPTEENGRASLYPKMTDMKYPKPGTPNPVVSVFVYDVINESKAELHDPTKTSNESAKPIETTTVDAAIKTAADSVMVTQVKWLNDQTLVIRETNRWSDAMRYVSFDCANVIPAATRQNGGGDSIRGTVVRRETTTVSGGWISVDQDVRPLKGKGVGPGSTAYVDIIAPHKGYRHVAYFADVTQEEPIFLTTGTWEVDKILFVHKSRVYFSAAYPRPAVRHILYVDIPSDLANVKALDRPANLTDVSETAWYAVNFDPKGNYYQLSYEGPSVPWVKVFSLRDPTFALVVEDNSRVRNAVAKYQQPQRVFYNITTSDGIVVSAEEWRPHDFDGSGATRYPVLINVYGGPNSQVVEAKWKMNNWRSFLCSTLGYIVIQLDGRGTGFRGREFRDIVSWHLGTYEAIDVIQAAEQIRRLPYVAQSKVGMWGWSYGGYLTAKVLEQDSGTFDLGMSVAPVSRWEFYDSIYTERYMKTPSLNKAGYENASVHITQGFQNSQFLLAQGSGDDNVHFQSSAMLLDQLIGQKIRGYWFRMFPDSSHSISARGAYRELHEFMTRFLVSNWGAGGKRIFRYEHEKDSVVRRYTARGLKAMGLYE